MLEEARIRYCQWEYAGGSLKYNTSYFHPDWDLIIQTYEVRSVIHDVAVEAGVAQAQSNSLAGRHYLASGCGGEFARLA